MQRNFYILNLKMAGIKNIEDKIELSFYKKTIKNDFDPEKYKAKAIYGENGSGKTAIITSVKLLQNIILDKRYLADTDTQKTLHELVNKKTRKGFVECEFYSSWDDTKYIFKYFVSFEINAEERFVITAEKLEFKNGNYSKNEYILVYETCAGKLIYYIDEYRFGELKNETLNLLNQQSFASCIFSSDIMSTPLPVEYVYILNLILFAVSIYVSIDNEDNHKPYFVKKKFGEMSEEEWNKLGMDYISEAYTKLLVKDDSDEMILKIRFESYQEQVRKMCSFIQIFKPELVDIDIDKKDNGNYYKCSLIMVYDNYSLDSEFESRGIKKLMALFTYLNSASNGSIVFIDELDSNINDVYLDKILEHFLYYGKGQLCFTAHNLSPMSVLKGNKNAISFISSINTVHTWTNNGNQSPENAYRNGFIEDSPFNVDASDFLGIIGGEDE